MSILDLFGIKEDAQLVDVVKNAPEIQGKIEQTNKALEDILNENPDLINNLNTTGGITEAQPKAFNAINNFYNQLTTPRFGSLGIMDLISTGKFAANPSVLGGIFSPIGALAIGGLKSLFSNIRDPYKSAFGNLNRQTREAINREQVRDLQDRIDKGQFGTVTPQDARRSNQYKGNGEGAGSSTGGQDTSGASGGAPGGGADASTY